MVFSCYEIQQLIQVMNYLTLAANQQNINQKIFNSVNLAQINQTNNVLMAIRVALSMDFQRYTDLINKKIMMQELMKANIPSKSQTLRPRTSSQPPLREKQLKASVPKVIQKTRPIKTNSTPKQQTPKPAPSPAPPTINPPISEKAIKKPTIQKVVSAKIKKKIHKIQEVKKENPGRIPRVSMIQTAEIGRSTLSDKDKKKLKERLLMRQVKQWRLSQEFKKDRRQLRTSH